MAHPLILSQKKNVSRRRNSQESRQYVVAPYGHRPQSHQSCHSQSLKRTEASWKCSFNTCNHQPLPLMHRAPLKFYIQDGAVPHAIHVPPSIPLHLSGKVMDAIKRDVALGVLEKVPTNTPSTWCHRMVITRKHNGELRLLT